MFAQTLTDLMVDKVAEEFESREQGAVAEGEPCEWIVVAEAGARG